MSTFNIPHIQYTHNTGLQSYIGAWPIEMSAELFICFLNPVGGGAASVTWSYTKFIRIIMSKSDFIGCHKNEVVRKATTTNPVLIVTICNLNMHWLIQILTNFRSCNHMLYSRMICFFCCCWWPKWL